MTVRKKEEKEEKEKEKEKGGLHKNTSSVDFLITYFHYTMESFMFQLFLGWISTKAHQTETDISRLTSKRLESQYIEVPNSDSYSDFDYLLVGHAVMIEPVCHWERVVRTRTEVHGISVGVIEKDASG